MGKFKIDEWVYTYDEQGLVYKHQVRGNVGVFYALTGKSEPVNTQYVFKTKKECLKAMKDAGIQKASLHMATVIKLENKVADLEAKLKEMTKKLELASLPMGGLVDKARNLEKQLAESENRVKDLEFRNKNLEHSLKVAPNANAGQRARIVELKEINHKLKQQLEEKEKEISKLYPFVKKYHNGIFVEYNVVYERDGIVATTTFGRNKEMAYNYLKSLKGEK